LFSEEQVDHLKEFKRQLKRNGKRFNNATLLPINDITEGIVVRKTRMNAEAKNGVAV
jgi:hypothetical protein